MAIEGLIEGFPDVKIHNADGTTGRKGQADSATVAVSTEDKAVLDSISGQMDMSLTALAAALENITIDVGQIRLRNAADTIFIDPATVGKQDSIITELVAANVDLAAIEVLLTSIDGKDFSTQATLSALNAKLNSLGQKVAASSAPVVIASDQSTLPISAANLPLPAGASTEAKQDSAITKLTSLDGKDYATQTTLALMKTAIDAIKVQTDKLTFVVNDLKVVDSSSPQSDFISSTPAYTTTDVFVQIAVPYNTKSRLNKTFKVENTGLVNSVDIEIRGSIDDGVTFPDIIRTQTLAPGFSMVRSDRNYYTHIQILAKATTAGLQSTVTSQIAAF